MEEQNTIHKPITWWNHIKASAYMSVSGLDARGVTLELKLRLKFYCSWCFFVCCILIIFSCYFLFILLLWVFDFYFYSYFLSIISTLQLSSCAHPYSHPLHSPSFFCTKIHCSPSLLLFLPPLIYSLPLTTPSPLNLPQTVTRLLFPLHTDHLLTNLLYLYTTPTLWNPWHKHPILQKQKYTQTHKGSQNLAVPAPLPPLTFLQEITENCYM
jgi:hypothetical protein